MYKKKPLWVGGVKLSKEYEQLNIIHLRLSCQMLNLLSFFLCPSSFPDSRAKLRPVTQEPLSTHSRVCRLLCPSRRPSDLK